MSASGRAAIVVALLLGSCVGTTSQGESTESPVEGLTRVDAAHRDRFSEWLPAGSYFREGHYEQSACEGCVEPHWAVALGPFTTEADATSAMTGSRGESLPPGYPWAVSTEDLEPGSAMQPGILVVLGLFATEEPARELAAHQIAARLLPLASRQEALARLDARLLDPSHASRALELVQIDAGPPAPAYRREDVERLLDDLRQQVHPSFEAFMAERDAATDQLEPICEVAADSVHLFVGGKELVRVRDHFAPVHCPSGELAYVRWTRTRLLSVVRPAGDGTHRIEQAVLIECDVPRFDEWLFGRDGRVPLSRATPRLVVAMSSGCGG